MPQPTREEAIRTLEDGRGLVATLLSQPSDEELLPPATIGDGDWSAKDLIGHLATWEEIALDSLSEWRRGERPAVEDVFGGDGTDRTNAEAIARKSVLPLDEVRAASAATHTALLDAIRSMSEEEWTARASYPAERRTTLAALLGSVLGAPKRPFGHSFAHVHGLRAYVDSLRTSA